ncbi:MAG TPA: hypothetical protein VFX15_01910 [Actinomycetes bacterium]|nr:hypothetical protein [Actinomycetes bacterium]
MTVRPVRGASLGVAGALVAGLVIAPLGGTDAVADEGPTFYPISADSVSSGAGGAAERNAAAKSVSKRPAAKAAVAKKTQILQVIEGIGATGATGVSVATGPKQTVEAAGSTIRAFTKSTGAQANKGSKSASAFFGLGGAFTVSQPTVVYDPVGKRFIVVAVTDEGGDIGLAMRISKGTAAAPLTNKKWRAPVAFANADSEPTADTEDIVEWNPKIGVTSDKIVVTVVAEDPNDAGVANRIFLLPKGPYYNGNTPGPWAADLNSTFNGQQPAVNATKQANAFVAIPSDDVMPEGEGEFTVTIYTGAAKGKEPIFSKNVVFPSSPLVAPPLVNQTGGDDLDLGELEFTGASWRANKLFTALTVGSGGRAAVKVFGVNTGGGVTLSSQKTLSNPNKDWFDPDLAIDKGGNVLVTAQDEGTAVGPSLAVFARKSNGKWVNKGKPSVVAASGGAVSGPGNPTDWWNSTGAAVDPTSPWDVWIAGSVGPDGTDVARVSLAKNKASIKASDTRVNKGKKVTFTAKLTRPDSKDAIKGLPIALQKAPASGKNWNSVKSGKTNSSGAAKWTLKIKKASKYRTLGKGKKQKDGAGVVFDQVTSKSVTIRLS